jgi:hypothetical protein
VLGTDLLLALVEDAHAQRQLAERRAVRLDRLETRHEIALVVRYPAREEMAVALGRLERWRLPLVERVGRLHVVVVVHEQRLLAATGLAHDRRRTAASAQALRVDAGSARALQYRARGLVDGGLLCGYGGEAHELLELVDILPLSGADVGIEGVE